ncbi:hypothetical protein D9M71_480160 [compost metagenome]
MLLLDAWLVRALLPLLDAVAVVTEGREQGDPFDPIGLLHLAALPPGIVAEARGQLDDLFFDVVAVGRGGQVVEQGLAGDTAEGVVGGFRHRAGDRGFGLRVVQCAQGALFTYRPIEPVMVGAGDDTVDVGYLGVPQRALVFGLLAIAIGARGVVGGLIRRHGLGARPVDGIIATTGFHAIGVLRFDQLVTQGAVQAVGGSFERATMGL